MFPRQEPMWWTRTLPSLDFETTGPDPRTAVPVSVALVFARPEGGGDHQRDYCTLVDPGVPIPPAATEVHGVTDADVRGAPTVLQVAEQLAHRLRTAFAAEPQAPLIVYNAPYDLTLLTRILIAHHCKLWDGHAAVVDPLVLDRKLDKWRKGSRRLADVAAHYGVPLGEHAHGAQDDAHAAAIVARRIAIRWPTADVHELSLPKLRANQRRWYGEWRDQANAYWARTGATNADGSPRRGEGQWPCGPFDASLEVPAA